MAYLVSSAVLSPLSLLKALHWRPHEAGIACLVQLDSSSESLPKAAGILPRLIPFDLRRIEVLFKYFTRGTKNHQLKRTPASESLVNADDYSSEVCQGYSPASPMQLLLLMNQTSSQNVNKSLGTPIACDNLAVGKAVKRFLFEPVLLGILFLQYAAVIVVMLTISFT